MGVNVLSWCVMLAMIVSYFGADSAETHFCQSEDEFNQNCNSQFLDWWNMDNFWSVMCNDVNGQFVFDCMQYQRNTTNECNATNDDTLFVALFEQYHFIFGLACEFNDADKNCPSVASCYDNIYGYSGMGYYTFYNYFCGSGSIGLLFTCLNDLSTSCPETVQWYSNGFAIYTPDGVITQTDLETTTSTECGNLLDTDIGCINTRRDDLHTCKPSPVINNGTISCGQGQSGCVDEICSTRVGNFYSNMFNFLECGAALIDECSNNLDDCGDNAECLDLPQGYSCRCSVGYSGDGYTCTESIEECGPGSCDINAMCRNVISGIECTCAEGYVADGNTCEDDDECNNGQHDCDINATCRNVIGSYMCFCNVGYTGDGMTCADIDECGQDACDSNGVCRNEPGSFECTCNEGYVFDGTTCTDDDECNNGQHDCEINATCRNVIGSYLCFCNVGYTGDGMTCADDDECNNGQHDCDINATCRNLIGSYMCFCNVGYTGDGMTCADIDYCATSPCENGGTCADGLNSYTCTCEEGYYGQTCGNYDSRFTWEQWGACSETCGESVRERTRRCYPYCTPTEYQSCFGDECLQNPTWSNWNRWGLCSTTCGKGTRQRTRTCIFPDRQITTLLACLGDDLQEESCSDRDCPILVCQERTDNYGTWPETNVKDTASLDCLHSYQQGTITRECKIGGIWENVQTNCSVNNAVLEDLAEQIDELRDPTHINDSSSGVVTSVVNVLEDMTQDVDNFNGSIQIIRHTLNIVNSINDVIQGTDDEIDAISEDVVGTLSNIIDIAFEEQWKKELQRDMSMSVVLETLDEYLNTVTELKCNAFADGEVFDVRSENIYAEMGRTASEITFPNTASIQGSSIEIPKQTLIKMGLSTVCYSGGQYTTHMDFIEDASSVSSNIGTAQLIGGGGKRNSDILAVQIAYQGRVENLSPPVHITLALRDTALADPVCVFWDFDLKTYGPNGAWSDRDCEVTSYNKTHVNCACTHLTNFAILMSPSSDSGAHTKILSIISAVGCAISMVCLLLTIILHCMVWRLVRSDRSIILMNLCVALLLALGIFLAGVNRTESREACVVIAALIQLFFLAVFFFMLLIGLEIFICVVHVFMTKFRIKILLPLAWLLPVLIVGITLGVTKTKGYGTDEFCWLDTDSGVIWAFIGPAALVILVNFVIILIVLKKMASSHVVKSKSTKVKVQTGLRSICVLVPVMGITWFMGLLSVNSDMVAFQYLFCLFNTLQGLLIFLFHCVFNRQIREALNRRNERRRSMQTLSSDLRRRSNTVRRQSNEMNNDQRVTDKTLSEGHRRDSAEDWARQERKHYHRRLREYDV